MLQKLALPTSSPYAFACWPENPIFQNIRFSIMTLSISVKKVALGKMVKNCHAEWRQLDHVAQCPYADCCGTTPVVDLIKALGS